MIMKPYKPLIRILVAIQKCFHLASIPSLMRYFKPNGVIFLVIFVLLHLPLFSYGADMVIVPGDGLQLAINTAGPNGSVYLETGIYFIKNPLIIAGYSGFSLKGSPGVTIMMEEIYYPVLQIMDSNDITIDGLNLSHSNPDFGSCMAEVILVEDSLRILVSNCDIHGSGTVGISLNSSEEVEIFNNRIHHNSWTAFYINTSNGIRIYNNIIYQNASFMVGYEMMDLNIYNNTIFQNSEEYLFED